MPQKMIDGRLHHWCEVCKSPNARFSFGDYWACAEHRERVEAGWIARGATVK